VAITSEVEENKRLNESQVKDLSGGDTISVRPNYGNPEEIEPTWKIWIFGNHKPKIENTDNAIWRRVRIIPFTYTIEKEKQIPMSQILEKFEEEAEGILAWAVEGTAKWKKEGLKMTARIKNAVEEYKSESDIFQQFLDDKCVFHPAAVEEKNAIYKAFKEWANENGETVRRSKRWVTSQLMERDCRNYGNYVNATHIEGVRLTSTVRTRPKEG